ncbi:tetratricopeptide repeat protein [Pararhodobacter sp. CCB-MM2]|uniref:tetratricopeptide repeat protein n=1 Tax=Pararhodobacter sp. CCB-MM2 TaxID=1786003 RepID=UPI0013145300|nr:tetratricopeptide repeat protein [Pararhodobacter sp. CCB-MM2]
MKPQRLTLALVLALAPLPALADSAPSDCDRLAGYPSAPRVPGAGGVAYVLDPAAAIEACNSELAATPADPYLRLQLANALLAADIDDPRAATLFEGLRDSLPAMARLRLGALTEGGAGGIYADADAARVLYEEGCAMNDQPGAMAACSNLALLMITQGAADEIPRALSLYEAACAAEDMGACINLGVEYEYGDNVAQDTARAQALYRQACDGGDPLGCANLGNGIVSGWADGTAEEATGLFRQACAMGEVQACSDLGVSYAQGEGVAVDASVAAMFYGMACEGGSALGCANLAEAYRDGKGVPQDPARAMTLMAEACDGEEGWGCLMQAEALQTQGGFPADAPLVLALLDRGCALGEAAACRPGAE